MTFALLNPGVPSNIAIRVNALRCASRLTKLTDEPVLAGSQHTPMLLLSCQELSRGFDAAHPAAGVLRHKQFLAAREESPEFAVRPDFYEELLATFQAMAPFVAFLNEPILARRRALERDPLTAELGPARRRRP